MYTKEELESMDNAQLVGIANSLGVKVSQNDEKESVIYAILDKAAEDSAANNTETPKRKRRAKRERFSCIFCRLPQGRLWEAAERC